MRPLKDKSHSNFTRPKTARLTDVPLLRSPLRTRRNTLTCSKSHSAPTPSSKTKPHSVRIEKVGSHSKSDADEIPIAAQFADRLDDHRVQIQTDVDKNLGDIHTEHVNQVESFSTQFEKELSLLREAEEPLRFLFAAEIIRIEGARSEGSHAPEYVEVVLEERFMDFQKLVKEKHQAISKLIDEWNDVQVQIIGLAAEILGPERVVIRKDKKHKEHIDFEKTFKQSKISHDQSEKDFENVLEQMSGLEQKTKDLTESTKYTMRKQQQERALIQQRHLKEISRLAKEMEFDEE